MEDEQALKDNQYTYGKDDVYTGTNEYKGNNYGWGFVSHPSCLAVANVTGEYSSTHIGINKIFEKGNFSGDSGCLIVESMDLGYPYINKLASSYPLIGRWLTEKGYPLPIYTTNTDGKNSEKTSAKTICFAWDGVIYLIVNTQRQLEGVKLNGHLIPSEGNNITNGTIETIDLVDLITLEEPNSNHWFVCGCSPMQGIKILANSTIGVESALTTDKTPTTGSSTFFCLGDNTTYLNASGEIVFCFATGTAKSTTQQDVADALNGDWRTAFEACKAYWIDIFDGLREKWINVPAKLRVKGYLSIGQILCNTYEGIGVSGTFLGAGAGMWYGNFIRDTSFVVKALTNSKPDLAGKLLDFYASCDPIYENNSFSIDGTGGSGHNTDNAPTFLLAVGEYYAKTGDLTRMIALETQINSALKYIEADFGNHWKPTDGHVEALHPHDFGDDSNDYFTMANTKYESMVDILWIAGLEAIVPVFTALNDDTKAIYCTTVATTLRSNLSDYIVPSGDYTGMMAHGITTSDTLDSTAMWAATFIYGAWLLGDADNWEWCKKSWSCLGVKGTPIEYCLSIANAIGAESKAYGWSPFYPIIALLAYRNGDFAPMMEITEYFPSGAFPEYITQVGDTDGKASIYTHAVNFPWGHASVLELINELV